MRIQINNCRRNPSVDSYLRKRIDLYLGRLSNRIEHLDATILDENNGKGGKDKICSINIKLSPRGFLHVRAKHYDVYSAIVKATHRAEAMVKKALKRNHHKVTPLGRVVESGEPSAQG